MFALFLRLCTLSGCNPSARGTRGHRTTMEDVGRADVQIQFGRNRRRGNCGSYPPNLADVKEETPNEKNAALKYREQDEEIPKEWRYV